MNLFAYDYPLLGALLTILWIAIAIGWIMTVINVIADVFVSDDLRGISKALWVILVVLLPLLGVLLYLIARGDEMAQHAVAAAEANEAATRAYIRDAAGSTADELGKLAELRTTGVLDDAEFAQAKARLIGA